MIIPCRRDIEKLRRETLAALNDPTPTRAPGVPERAPTTRRGVW